MILPAISVVTPSFNQGDFIERTIKSLLAQEYPSLEHIVIDGGSTDDTVAIIKRYEGSIAYWESERDSGQSEAINKGMRRATGDILCWLNSDDFFEPGTLKFVGNYFHQHSEVDAVCGHVQIVDTAGAELYLLKGNYGGRLNLLRYWQDYSMHQPSIFWRRNVYETLGGLNERLHLTMDYDYWLRMAAKFNIVNVNKTLSSATLHAAQKTAGGFAAYRRAQLRDALRFYGLPRHLRDFHLSFALYRHLLVTAFKRMTNQTTVYWEGDGR